MGKGHEYLASIHQRIREFEQKVVERERWKPLESKVTRQQEVDHARQRLVDAIVNIVTNERMKKG
ncbi:MAG: hypothetical protein PVF27_06935 [Gemmatimonadales bacterium]|jgi:hypothetical protein